MITRDQLKHRINQQAKIRELSLSNKPMPSIGQQMKNVGNSIVKTVQSVAAGNPLNISDIEKDKRLSVCKTCEWYNVSQERCSKCGCFLKVKTYLKAERCPIGKW
jgi:hypothetical protein